MIENLRKQKRWTAIITGGEGFDESVLLFGGNGKNARGRRAIQRSSNNNPEGVKRQSCGGNNLRRLPQKKPPAHVAVKKSFQRAVSCTGRTG